MSNNQLFYFPVCLKNKSNFVIAFITNSTSQGVLLASSLIRESGKTGGGSHNTYSKYKVNQTLPLHMKK